MATPDAVLFVADRDGLGPIFDSAYLTPARLLQKSGVTAGVVSLTSAGTSIKPSLRRKWRAKVDHWRPSLSWFWSYPTLPRSVRSVWQDRFSISHSVQRVRHIFRPRRLTVATGSATLVPILAQLRKRGAIDRVVYHVWGPDSEEKAFALRSAGSAIPSSAELERSDALQRTAVRLSDANISISRPMTAWLIDQMQADKSTIFEIPWLADGSNFTNARRHRLDIRKQLELGDSFVLGYSGSMLSWQLDPAALYKVVAACRKAMKNVSFLGLTMHQDSMRRALQQSGLTNGDARILSVPFSEMPNYLAAMDLGILGRNLFQAPDIVNRLSSPVKFGEYLLSGVPVVLSGAIEDFAEIVRAHNVGVVIGETATSESLANDLSLLVSPEDEERAKLSNRCIETGKRHLTYQSRMKCFAEALDVELR